ncbi:MAG: DEAD/DEAH box helicase, partial [Chloroflexota bacterium]|nr:DEAD/DEAH box helicase [Chloroflexota bacterium]
PTTAQNITALAQSLPPVCRAAVPDPSAAPTPRALLNDFLTASVDATVREISFKPRLSGTTPGGKWLQALLGPDPIVKLKGPEADELYKSWQAWARQTQVAGDDVFRVTFRLEPPEHGSDLWNLEFLLQATDDPSLIVPATLVWREQGPIFTYLHRRFEQPQERLLAALGYAARVFPPIDASLRRTAPERAHLSPMEAFTFLKEAAPLLEQSGFGVLVPAWWSGRGARVQVRAQARPTSPQPSGQSRLSLDTLVNFNWELTLAGQPIDRTEFERLVALKSPLVRIRGQWVVLDPDQMQRALAFFEQRDGELDLAETLRLALGGDGQVTPQGIAVEGVEAEGWLHDLLHGLNDLQHLQLLPTPTGLRGALRSYQVRGYSWMAFLRRYGLGACLADDMGLGKTPTTISLLLHERERLGVTAPALVVCPTSVIGNWARELQRFAPSLRVLAHRGPDRQQGVAFEAAAAEHDVILTSYPLLARDRETLVGVRWGTVVLDEAQNIKNPGAKQAQAARAINATSRVALTGTPVENRLSELWSIMAFLNPGYLGSEAAFRREFARPIERTGDPQARERLRQLTAPFVLRRLKTDPTIISDLPEKLEMKVYCSLTPEQATLYQAVVQEELEQIEEAETEGSAIQRRGRVLALLMKLKQVCNHPAQFLKDGSMLDGRSGKLARLKEMLEEVYAEDDRALIFTQFAEMGSMLQRHLQQTLYDDVLFLHGGTPAKERDTMVRRFQAQNGPHVFILSLKAGGTGLNLTTANHVFHYDRWWNPAVENQATDRAFRIGQTRNVQVHKFICGGTLEEHIDELIESKRALAASVLDTSEDWLTELSTTQLRELVALRQADVVEE